MSTVGRKGVVDYTQGGKLEEWFGGERSDGESEERGSGGICRLARELVFSFFSRTYGLHDT